MDESEELRRQLAAKEEARQAALGVIRRQNAAIDGVREIHQPVAGETDTQWCQVCSQDEEQPQPIGWWVPWPCPTIQALEAD